MKRAMVGLTIVIVGLILWLIIVATIVKANAGELNYEGVLSPNAMLKWDRTNMGLDTQGYWNVVYTNPDKKAEINYVRYIFLLKTNKPGKMLLVGYKYLYRGQLHMIVNDGKGFYKMVLPRRSNA